MLEHLGVPTMLAPHPSADVDIDLFPKDREEMLMRWLNDVVGVPQAFITSYPPDVRSARVVAPAIVSYSAFEAAPVSDFGVMTCNDEAQTALWCVSDFTRRCYVSSGVAEAKTRTVAPAVCDGPWRASVRALKHRTTALSTETPFVFGAVGTWHERKGFRHLVRAYFDAFTRQDPVALAIRTSYFGERRPTMTQFEQMVIAEIAKIATEYGDDNYPASRMMPRLRVLTGTTPTDNEVIDWLGTIDCYVNPSFGEGLGIPQIWSLARGTPVITSDYGAVGDLVKSLLPEFGRFAGEVFPSVPTQVPREMRRHSPFLSEKSMWGGYEPEALASRMGEVFLRGPCRSEPMAQAVQERFSFEQTKPALVAALSALVRADILGYWVR
jgi:glycosyltransferase involved in cell wall biosynthesis